MDDMIVYKFNEQGKHIWHYTGRVLFRDVLTIQLEAFFNRKDYTTPYHTFREGDRMVEWFYSQRWYNIFQMHDVDDDHLKGWYCNITRPARFEDYQIYTEDLALDVFIYPDGHSMVLDEEEFASLEIDNETRHSALQGLQELITLVEGRLDMFSAIQR
ncbi:MAG: DUF402 domain-containing protein [Anaerolineae bacterium]|jgi:protein associated with RNAse G/E|nr:DUF402 domain-containing protein [Anaerolineae bacterium]